MTIEPIPTTAPSITVGAMKVRTEVLQLADGRRLAWSEYGAPTGRVLIHCHGNPSSRLEGLVLHHAAPHADGER